MRKFFGILILILFEVNFIYAQTSSDSLNYLFPETRNVLSSRFDKLLNTSILYSKFMYKYSHSDWETWIDYKFNSTIISSTRKNIKDEQNINWAAAYRITNNLHTGILIRNISYSDDRQFAFNKASVFNSLGYLSFIPIKELNLKTYGGYSNNVQVNEEDTGIIYGVEGSLNQFKSGSFDVTSALVFQNEDISPRKNTIRILNFSNRNLFENYFTNIISGEFSEKRKDFYFASEPGIMEDFNVENNIQSRIEKNYSIGDRMLFDSPQSDWAFAFDGKVSRRDIDRETRYVRLANITTSSFDTRIEELRIDFGGIVSLRRSWMNNLLKLNLTEREENHIAKDIPNSNRIIFEEKKRIENQKSNRSQLITLSYSGEYYISDTDIFQISAFHRKLMYDTPSDENFDDRDELLSIARIAYSKQLTPFLNLFTNLEGSINQISYLFSERSSNNNKNRSIKLSAGGRYSGLNFVSSNSAEVSANYTTYDFEEMIPTLNSFSFRQYAFKDSSVIKLSRQTAADFIGYIKLSEQGDFNWDNFSGRPARFLEEIYLEPKLKYLWNFIKMSVGLRYFTLSTFNYDENNNKLLTTRYKSLGPLVEINILYSEALYIKMFGYYEFIEDESNNKRERANMNLEVNWNI